MPRPGEWSVAGALTNVGTRPTFEPQVETPRVEVYLLDFQSDLYGQHLRLDFLEWLRPEEKFPTVQALVDQMQLDIRQGRLLLASDKVIDPNK